MLIEFRVANFRSFKAEQTFSMVAEPFAELRESNTFRSGLKGFSPFLRSAAIYGPNAAGKTNLLRAVEFMQQMVVHSATQTAGAQTTYCPHKLSAATCSAPSEFQVTFAERSTRYEYGFALSADRIEREWLIEYAAPRGRTLFDRQYNGRKRSYDYKFSPHLRGQRTLWSEATRPDALFLSTAIQLNSSQLTPVFEWFNKRLVVIVGNRRLNPDLTINLLEQEGGKERLLPFLQEADLGIVDLQMQREAVPMGGLVLGSGPAGVLLHQRQGRAHPDLVRVTLSHWNERKEQIVLDFADESSGTQLLFRAAGAWLNVFERGEVLLFDEIDTSLHPLLTRYLIQKFHSPETNPRNAQLIFSTHNTSLLTQDILRRDQVWFVEKDVHGASTLYPLTDFSPRNDEALERGYMRGRYGALPILPAEKSK